MSVLATVFTLLLFACPLLDLTISFQVSQTQEYYFWFEGRLHPDWILDKTEDIYFLTCLQKCQANSSCSALALGLPQSSERSHHRTCYSLKDIDASSPCTEQGCEEEHVQVYHISKMLAETTTIAEDSTSIKYTETTVVTEEMAVVTEETTVVTEETTAVGTSTPTVETTTFTTKDSTTTTSTKEISSSTPEVTQPPSSTTESTTSPETTTKSQHSISTLTTEDDPDTTTSTLSTTMSNSASSEYVATEEADSTTESTTTEEEITSSQVASTESTATPLTTTPTIETSTTEASTTVESTSTTTETSTEEKTTTEEEMTSTGAGDACKTKPGEVSCLYAVERRVIVELKAVLPLFSDGSLNAECKDPFMEDIFTSESVLQYYDPFSGTLTCPENQMFTALEFCLEDQLVYLATKCTKLVEGFSLETDENQEEINNEDHLTQVGCSEDEAIVSLRLSKNDNGMIMVNIRCGKISRKQKNGF